MALSNKVHLLVTTQKNGVPNETLTHGTTDNPLLSPVGAILRRVCHLRANNAPPDAPLYQVYTPQGIARIKTTDITNALRSACRSVGHTINIKASDMSAHSLRAGGATSLLRANADPTEIQLVGRWRSWAMIRCLHRTALDTAACANRMLTAGHFATQEHSHLPTDVLTTLARNPPVTTSSPPSESMDVETTPWHVAKSIIG